VGDGDAPPDILEIDDCPLQEEIKRIEHAIVMRGAFLLGIC
jgi:hypothetical protein